MDITQGHNESYDCSMTEKSNQDARLVDRPRKEAMKEFKNNWDYKIEVENVVKTMLKDDETVIYNLEKIRAELFICIFSKILISIILKSTLI